MALQGSQCDQLVGFIVRYRSYGGFIESSPQLSPEQLQPFIDEIGAQNVVQIIPVNANGQRIDCCPTGFVWDPGSSTCIPQPQCANPNDVPKNPDGTCPTGYVPDPNDPNCCMLAPPQCQNPLDVPKNADGSCPVGYVPDPNDPNCCMPKQGGGGGGDGGDELGDCCAAIVVVLEQLVVAVQTVSQGSGQQTSQCCNQVVAAITGIARQLTLILKFLPNLVPKGDGAIDLSQIVAELTCVCEALTAIASAPPLDLSPIKNALDAINSTLAGAKPVDVQGVVDAIKAQTKEFTFSRTIGDALVKGGFINKDVAQLITGGETSDWGIMAGATWFHELVRGAVLKLTGYDFSLTPSDFGGAAEVQTKIASALSKYLKSTDTVLAPYISGVLDTVKTQVAPASTPPLGSAGVSQDQAIQSASAVAVTALVASILVDYLGWDIGESTARIAEIAASAVGFEELRDVQVGPLVRHGIAKVADMNARALFQQEIPGVGQVVDLLARGLLDESTADLLLGWNGLHTSLRAQVKRGAAGGLNARMMLRLIDTGLLTSADIQDELTFGGLRPASQSRLLKVAPYLATQPQRQQLKAALENAYLGGLLSDADLINHLDAADSNLDAHNLILLRAQWIQLTKETKDLETEYANVFKAGIIDDLTFRQDLAGLGLQPNYVNFVAGKAEVAANVTLQKQTIREARALARATSAVERRAAFAAYNAGTIDEAALTAALASTGLTPIEALSWTAFEVLRSKGTPRFIFGLKLDPASALLLKARVTDLTDQRKRQLITESAYLAALQGLQLPARWINALNAGAEAMLTPKSAAFVVPVQTG